MEIMELKVVTLVLELLIILMDINFINKMVVMALDIMSHKVLDIMVTFRNSKNSLLIKIKVKRKINLRISMFLLFKK